MPLGANKAAIMGVAGTGVSASVVLLNEGAFTNQTAVSFASTLTSTYKQYIFAFYSIAPATNNTNLTFQVNATDDDGGDYDQSQLQTNHWRFYNAEADGGDHSYRDDGDQANGTAFQMLTAGIGSGADESASGIMYLFDPASTTYVKHFISEFSVYQQSDYNYSNRVAGYINDTTAIDDIQFKMSDGGQFDGEIKIWGVL